jgi:LAO/AO transport system kinase
MEALDPIVLADQLVTGDPRALARAISLVENDHPAASVLMRRCFPHTGRAYVIGVTGPPGVGKSTLVDALTGEFRRAGRTVGILAVDPSSPFTGGALLGDRIRMQARALDEGVFVRSMATRGHLGGLAPATAEAALLLDAAGKQIVLIETVGVGQDEVDVASTADVCLVVFAPGSGDEIQALKAGLMEVADVLVVNKADRPGVEATVAALEAVLALNEWPPDAWRPPVLTTEATRGKGVAEVVATIDRFRHTAGSRQQARRRARLERRLRELLQGRLLRYIDEQLLGPGGREAIVDRLLAREIDPYTAVDQIVGRLIGKELS